MDISNIQTEPKSPGQNPTLNTTMKFQVPLPTQILYCPTLTCQVYDYILRGFNQPLIGVFTIPIGELMHELIQKRSDEIILME